MTDLLTRPAAALAVEPLTSTLGAVVHELDVVAGLAPESVVALRRALLQHRVLFLRDQHLSPSAQVALARLLGQPTPAHPLAGGLDEQHPEVLVLDSRAYLLGLGRRDGATSYNDRWHVDVSFVEEPPAGSVLCAEVIPDHGGDTLWCDLVDAFATLSEPLRALLEPLTATHSAAGAFAHLEATDRDADRRAALARLAPVVHPVVRVHPETGEKILFVNQAFTRSIDQLGERESEALLALLFEHATAPERTVRWHWRSGDVAIWDNRATAHYAMADYAGQHRRMRRVTLAGDRPVGPR